MTPSTIHGRLVCAALLLFTVIAPFGTAHAFELVDTVERAGQHLLDQVDAFAIGGCDPPCPGQICCDNGVCVSTVLACGAFPILIDSLRLEASPTAQVAGFMTHGLFAAEHGRRARLFFGHFEGAAWAARGVPPGTYELVLAEGATADRLVVEVNNPDGETVARLGDHFWVFYGATTNVEASWRLDEHGLRLRGCQTDGRCIELVIGDTPFGGLPFDRP